MIISAGFSAAVYQVSVNALDESLRLQIEAIQRQPRFRVLQAPINFDQIYDEQLANGRQRIFFNLLGVNVVVLLLGGAGSYWLAGRTLRPIEEALEGQRRFTADASHELRTPLTAMRTEIEVALRDKGLKLGAAQGLLNSNLEEIDKLRSLADSLLTLSKYQSDGVVEFHAVELREVVDAAVGRLGGMIKQASATVHVGGGNVALKGDQDSLVALVVILVENSLKYSRGKPQINVEISKTGRRAEITVKDNGAGIAAGDLPKIFDRFYRADSSRSKATTGYGLGLSIARQITDMHRGTIAATSEPKKGTTVMVSLPLSQPKQSLPL